MTGMTVRELMNLLGPLPSDAVVYLPPGLFGRAHILRVRVIESDANGVPSKILLDV